jgi:hypothetical protein
VPSEYAPTRELVDIAQALGMTVEQLLAEADTFLDDPRISFVTGQE